MNALTLKIMQNVAYGTIGVMGTLGSLAVTNTATIKEFLAPVPQPVSLASTVIDGTRALGKQAGEITLAAMKNMSWKDYLLIGGGAYGAWVAYELGAGNKFVRTAGALLPGFRKIRKWIGRIEVVPHPDSSRENYRLESRKEGSEEFDLTPPKCQAAICEMKDDVLVKIGCAVRFNGNFLVGPDHVMGENGLPKYAVGRQNSICLDGKERFPLDTDLVAIRMTDKEMSTIGVSVTKIGAIPSKGLYGQIVGVDGRGTTGVLKMDRVAFGRVVYDGTTLPGYSGAAYSAGAFVAAIHQSGGAVNGGYAAGYIWMLLKEHIPSSELVEFESKNSDADTPQWLTGQFSAGKKIRWRKTGDPELVELMLDDGTFSRVKPVSMAKAFGPTWQDQDVLEKGFDRTYRDVSRESILESTSGEASGSKHPGALNMPEEDQESGKQSPPYGIKEFLNLSRKHQEDALRYARQQLKQNSTSNGQAKTSATKSS